MSISKMTNVSNCVRLVEKGSYVPLRGPGAALGYCISFSTRSSADLL